MILTIDGDHKCWQMAYTTFKPMECRGVEVDVIYKFLNSFRADCRAFGPENVAVAWDSRQSRRRRIFPKYKDRKPTDMTEPEKKRRRSIRAQMKILRTHVLPKIGLVNNFHQIGYEGDDIMASIVFGSEELCLLITADKDMFQLLSMCEMYCPSSKVHWDEDMFVETYGIKPSQWKSVKQIGGCSSDKVPGVEGVAEGRALAFIKGEMKETSKFYQRILDSEELIARNAKLVNLPFPGTEEFRIQKNDFDMQGFVEVCKEFEFNSFMKDLDDWEDLFYEELY